MNLSLRRTLKFGSALTAFVASGIGLALAVEGPLASVGLVERLAGSADLSGSGRGLAAGSASTSRDRGRSFENSNVVLPLLVGDLAIASSPSSRPIVARSARVRPPVMTTPMAAR